MWRNTLKLILFRLLVMAGCMGVLAWLSPAALAWSLLGSSDVVEKPLLKEEYQRLQIKAGWPDDQPTKLIFEIGNRMEAPIQCVGATVELKEGRSLNKTFSPKVFVPGKSQRNGSVQDVVKGSMKDYAVLCTCFRQQGQGACVNPLKRNG